MSTIIFIGVTAILACMLVIAYSSYMNQEPEYRVCWICKKRVVERGERCICEEPL
jgi:hypothetical protein